MSFSHRFRVDPLPPPVNHFPKASDVATLPPLSGLLPTKGSALRTQKKTGHNTIWAAADHVNTGIQSHEICMRTRVRAPPPDVGDLPPFDLRFYPVASYESTPWERRLINLAVVDDLVVMSIDTGETSSSPAPSRKFLTLLDNYFNPAKMIGRRKPKRKWLPRRWLANRILKVPMSVFMYHPA